MSINFIDEYIDDDVQLMIDDAQALLKVTNLDLLREVVAEVRFKVRNGMPMLSNDRRKYILAITAIDKQIPYKPNKKGYPIDSDIDPLVYGCCPRCNTHMDSSKAYCYKCGQAIDWCEDNG